MRSTTAIVLAISVFIVGCDRKQVHTAEKGKPATVQAFPNEADAFRISLTPKAEERLQIRTEKAMMRSVPRSRTLGGQIVVPDGQRIPVTAPLAGTLTVPTSSQMPIPGTEVAAHQALFELTPILRPELEVPGAAERVQMANANAMLTTARIQADGDTQQVKAQLDGATIALDRARKLFGDRAGSKRDVDSAEVALNVATKAWEAATERKTLFEKLTLDAKSGKTPIVTITAPTSGTVQTVMAQVGQVVSVGAPILEIVDLRRVWVRVSVYAGQVHEIDHDAFASMTDLSRRIEPKKLKPVNAPPTADPIAASIDLYYELENDANDFHPGERVTVSVPFQGEAESLVVPRASIVRDFNGVAWVYIRTAEHEFRRKRVSIRITTEELAILDGGVAVNSDVVVDGAAELFGTEFGAGK